jgi:uncharacterized protein YndB with AHSA1/START domain
MMAEGSTTEVTADGIKMTRVFDAPRELVWRAWTEPEHFAEWFGEPGSKIPLETASMDVKPGGEWSVIMHAEGREIPFVGEYREVEEPERLVLDLKDPGEPDSPNREVLTVVLTDLGDGKTKMDFRQTGTMSEEEYGRAAKGSGIFFERLAEHLPQMA